MTLVNCTAQIFRIWNNFKLCTSNPFVLLLLLKHGFQNMNSRTARIIGFFCPNFKPYLQRGKLWES